jgi:ribosomal protein S18 acetylase RimI-like enzyme
MIKPAIADDAEALSVLVNSAYRGESSKAGWTTEADLLDGTRTDAEAIRQTILTPGSTILKYTENRRLSGCVELVRQGERMYLGMLTVEPTLQGTGIGKKILYEAEHFAKGQGCRLMYMTVISMRKELIAWYERHGYRRTGERKPFAFSDPRFGQPKMPLEFIVLEKGL